MTVNLTIAKTLTGSAINDSLTGGSSGYDFGISQTGAVAPNNPVFLSHDGVNPITELAVNVQQMSGTYGGDYSASADITKLLAHGDGGSNGLQCDFTWNDSPLFTSFTQFKTGTGSSYASRIVMPTTAMSRNNSSVEVAANTPVAGQLGASADATLGDRAHMTFRYTNPGAETQNGKRQIDLYFSFNFTT